MNRMEAIFRQLNSDQSHYDKVVRIPIGLGDLATERTVQAMRAVIDDAADAPLVHQVASTIVAHSKPRSETDQLRGLYDFSRRFTKFKRDTSRREVLRLPEQVISEIQTTGMASLDCDDQTMTLAAIARAMGMRPAIVTVAPSARGPFKHVHPAVLSGGKLVPLDPQERIPLGVWTPARRRKAWWA